MVFVGWFTYFAIFMSVYEYASDKQWLTQNLVWYTYGVVMVMYCCGRLYFFIQRIPTSQPESESKSVENPGSVPVPIAENRKQHETPDTDLLSNYNIYHPEHNFDALFGMHDVKQELNTAIARFRDYSQNKGAIADRNGILLYGPPGNGKTRFAEAIAAELNLPIIQIKGSDIQSRWVNQSAEQVSQLFKVASRQPCVLFFDEFETVALNRVNDFARHHHEDNKVVTALLPEIDAARRKRIVLIAATNHVGQVDPAIMRDGRFDFRIEITHPDFDARVGILSSMLIKHKVQSDDKTIHTMARLWERRPSAFIESVVKRLRDEVGSQPTLQDFKNTSRAASRSKYYLPQDGVKLSDLALPESVRKETNSLLYRLRHWEEITERGGEPPSGVLLYGPPGTGKTNLVRSLALELGDWHVFEVNAADVLHDPRKFRDTMMLVENHRPAIVFIDEADDLLRNRVSSMYAAATNEILKSMDGMMGKLPEVVFIAATNNPECMDAAALRGGRFGEKIPMGLLKGADLVALLEKAFADRPMVKFAADLTPQSLAAQFEEVAPSDVLSVLRKAVNYTFSQQETNRPVCMEDVLRAIEKSRI